MEYLSNNHKDCPNQHEDSHKLYSESEFDGKSMDT